MTRLACALLSLTAACAPSLNAAPTAAIPGPSAPLLRLAKPSPARLGPPVEAGFGRRHVDELSPSALRGDTRDAQSATAAR